MCWCLIGPYHLSPRFLTLHLPLPSQMYPLSFPSITPVPKCHTSPFPPLRAYLNARRTLYPSADNTTHCLSTPKVSKSHHSCPLSAQVTLLIRNGIGFFSYFPPQFRSFIIVCQISNVYFKYVPSWFLHCCCRAHQALPALQHTRRQSVRWCWRVHSINMRAAPRLPSRRSPPIGDRRALSRRGRP